MVPYSFVHWGQKYAGKNNFNQYIGKFCTILKHDSLSNNNSSNYNGKSLNFG